MPTGNLVDHLDPLTVERSRLKEPGGVDNILTGKEVDCDAVKKAPKNLRGMDFADIKSAMDATGREPRMVKSGTLDPQRRAGGERMEWEFEDGSKLVIDYPRPQPDNPRPASAELPHAELFGPEGERLDEQGIVVPGESTPAHITITDYARALDRYFAASRK